MAMCCLQKPTVNDSRESSIADNCLAVHSVQIAVQGNHIYLLLTLIVIDVLRPACAQHFPISLTSLLVQTCQKAKVWLQ